MKIFSSEQLKNIIEQTIREGDISRLELIQNAAESITGEITSRWKPGIRLVVFAGWDNNGADALETSRLLAGQGYNPEVYLFNIHDKISPECRTCRDRLLSSKDSFSFLEIDGREPFAWPDLDSSCLVLDGLFGSNLDKPLAVPFRILISNINNSGSQVVSIDIPSGLFNEWNGEVSTEHMIHATLTLALGTPHLPFMLADYASVLGEWKVLDIGLSPEAIRQSPYKFLLVERNTVRQFLPPRDKFATKADFGSSLVCAGSRGMMGAAVLAARGALRTGAGKVTVHSAECGLDVLQTAVPSAMFDCDRHRNYITEFPTDNQRYTATAVGPGIGTSDETVIALERFLKARNAASAPVILDADALNCMARKPLLLDYLPVLSVITPHAGEFDRLFGSHQSHEARLKHAIDLARFHRIIIVLKGHFTAIVRPDGKVFFNSSGCAAMATGGSGDVLTGMICGLMAQGFKPEKATFIACYIHGLAGEFAAARFGDYATTAADIADNIGNAICRITE